MDYRDRGERTSQAQILDSRENRAQRQKELIKRYGVAVVSFTMNIPGEIKSSPSIKSVFADGLEAVTAALLQNHAEILFFESRYLPTGPEAFFCVSRPAAEIKKLLCTIEEGHKAGRLFDIDVIGTDFLKISRSDIGLKPRRCLLCGCEAVLCARGRRHDREELADKISRIISECMGEKEL